MIGLTWLVTAAVAAFLAVRLLRRRRGKSTCPLKKTERKQERRPYVTEQKLRDKVLKQGFDVSKIPDGLDAVFVGSGIGSLSAAALMAKAGKKVLVLEQHDQAGGCCHTFVEHGYEFDVGIHYVGMMGFADPPRVLLDQITDDQLEWAKMEEEYDKVSIGPAAGVRKAYTVREDRQRWKEVMKEQFPEEHAAIDKLFGALIRHESAMKVATVLKMLPRWVAGLAEWSGLASWAFGGMFGGAASQTTLQTVQGWTSNRDLQTVMCYCWGDYGTLPTRSTFPFHSVILNHYKDGAFYPVGGASEIAFNIIPVIERAGGRVLVRAPVTEILLEENGRASGVSVRKGGSGPAHTIRAPIVVSGAGVHNTFGTLLPGPVAASSKLGLLHRDTPPAITYISVFVGLDASGEALGLKPQNLFHYESNDLERLATGYLSLTREEALDVDPPFLYVSFPSSKDPRWAEGRPGRASKSTMAVISVANYGWFEPWAGTTLKKRGVEYESLKKTIGGRMLEQSCRLFPQVRDHVDFVEVGSPLSNAHYIGQAHGEIYGLDHTRERFSAANCSLLRAKTDVPGLYLTGQDVACCGFVGALFGGLHAAGSVLGQNLFVQLEMISRKMEKEACGRKK